MRAKNYGAALPNICQQQRHLFFHARFVPILMVVGTLLVAAPVYCEFRYAYTVFTTLPLILPVTLYSVHNKG